MKMSEAYLRAAEELEQGKLLVKDTCINAGRYATLHCSVGEEVESDLHTFMCDFYPHVDDYGEYEDSPGLGTLALCFMIEVAKDEESKQEEEKKQRASGA